MTFEMEAHGIDTTIDRFDNLEARWTGMGGWTVVAGVEYAVYVEYGTWKMDPDRSLRRATRTAMKRLDTIAERSSDGEELGKNVAEFIADQYRQGVPVDTGDLKRSITIKKVSD